MKTLGFRNFVWWIVNPLFLGLLALLQGCDDMSLAGSVRTEAGEQWEAPNGLYILESYYRQTGAGDPFYSYLTLRLREDDVSDGEDILVLKGKGRFDVVWKGADEARISYGSLEVVRRVTDVWGKHFEFERLESK